MPRDWGNLFVRYIGFAVLNDFLCGFAVSTRPQRPPLSGGGRGGGGGGGECSVLIHKEIEQGIKIVRPTVKLSKRPSIYATNTFCRQFQ